MSTDQATTPHAGTPHLDTPGTNAPLALAPQPGPILIERRESDTPASFAALSDYCAMGPKRSLLALHKRYAAEIEAAEARAVKAKAGEGRGEVGARSAIRSAVRKSVPTPHLSTLESWSTRHDWQSRAAAYDEAVCAAQRLLSERELTSGLALPGERVRVLKALAARLLDEHGSAMLLSVERNENGLLAQLRGLFDDIAKETGGRKVQADITSKGEAIGGHSIIVAGHEITF